VPSVGVIVTRFDQKLFYMASPALNRELDVGKMVEQAMAAILHDPVFSKMLMLDPFNNVLWADAVLTIAFPDPALLELGRVGAADKAEVVRAQQLKVLGAIDAATNYIKTSFKIDHRGEEMKHETDIVRTQGAAEGGGDVLVEVVRLSVTLWDFRSIHVLKMMLEKFLAADQLQLARDIRLVVRARGNIAKVAIDAELFDGLAARRPVSTWLTLAQKADVLRWFSIPEVAAMVADGCRGRMVSCDVMNAGAAVGKRHNVSEGRPITIIGPADVAALVDGLDAGAFYPWIEQQDGSIGRLVCDLDMGKGLVGLLGPQRAWAACCAVSDAIVRGATTLGLAMPARLFSGSRGIHVVWDVDLEAFGLDEGDGMVALAGYRAAVLAAEPKAEHLESLRQYVRKPGFASRLFLEAAVLHAMQTEMGNGTVLDDDGRRVLGAARDSLACTLVRKDVDSYQKVVVDCQPLDHRWLSPHHKSGRVARSIVDGAGAIRQEFRSLARLQDQSELRFAAEEVAKQPDRYAPRPGFVPAAAIRAACEPRVLGATITALLAEGHVACCTMPATRYTDLHGYYAGFLEQKKSETG
jgi:hypothetical protein